ncbi:hypothetical protein, partial [Kineococcus vitellinus]|uniref:hypothetical protein n=1 Tax=Kineococcus vitellinus TaxID=2696565 RepID=UPI00196AED26
LLSTAASGAGGGRVISVEHGTLAGMVVLTLVVGLVRLWIDVRSELARPEGGVDGVVPRPRGAGTWS